MNYNTGFVECQLEVPAESVEKAVSPSVHPWVVEMGVAGMETCPMGAPT